MLTENELDNLLVGQKNRILQFLNEGETRPALDALLVVCELWAATDYAYKGEEICTRIIRELADDADHPIKDRETYLRAYNLRNWFTPRVTQRA